MAGQFRLGSRTVLCCAVTQCPSALARASNTRSPVGGKGVGTRLESGLRGPAV